MPKGYLEFPDPDKIVLSSQGEPGHRTFFFQVKKGETLVTVKLEKQHIFALGESLQRFVKKENQIIVADTEMVLEEPINSLFDVGTIAMQIDRAVDRLTIIFNELGDEIPDEQSIEEIKETSENSLEVVLDQQMAAKMLSSAGRLIVTGRPPCPLCSFPLDPSGHVCPRKNGHSPPHI
jgi:uncharacterized repeat protein (TIGR03847 family)